jgi:proteasome accessory factor A
LARGIQAFLVTRQIVAGAGKFAIEEEDRFVAPGFQISQRSDFFSELQSVDTMQRRPIVNTRDEPHANPNLFRRFHVILGDANMSPFSTRLKIGTTALVLEALARNPKRSYSVLADPLQALVAISRDGKFHWEVALQDKKTSTALELQREYMDAVFDLCDLSEPSKATIAADWKKVLEDLEADPMRCRDRLDWAAKLALIREFQAAQNVGANDPWLQSLDLEYHRLDREKGLYYALEKAGSIVGVPPDAAVRQAISEPPRTTRAYIRGRCIQKFASAVVAAQWDHITLQGSHGPLKISLLDVFTPEEVAAFGKVVDAAQTPDDLESISVPVDESML